MSLAVEDLRIDLHAPGVDHRAEQRTVPVVDPDDARLVILAGHLSQSIERTDSQQRNLQSVAEPLGKGDADAQPRIGARPLADGHRIEFVGRNARFAQQFIDEEAHLARMVAPLVALAERQ